MIKVGDRVIYTGHPDRPQGEVLSVNVQSGTAMVELWPIGSLIQPGTVRVVSISDLEIAWTFPQQSQEAAAKCLCGGSSVYGDENDPNPIYHDLKYCPLGKGK